MNVDPSIATRSLAPDESTRTCPSCGCAAGDLLLRSNNGYSIVRCSRCRLAFTDLSGAPSPSSLYPQFDQSDALVQRLMRRCLGVFVRQRESIVRDVKKRGRLLDFGCGNGGFARWMADAGYDVVGLEPFSLGHPVERSHLLLIREPLESAKPRLGRFDVITLWHVLEHLPRPVEVLRTLSQLLAPDGVMIVSVPNFLSWQSLFFGGGWFHLDPPRHIVHFEARTLENALHEAGLRVDRRWNFLPEYGSSGWVQSSLNRLLPHQNYLYEIVKDRGALKTLGVAQHALHLAASAVASAPLLALSTPVELCASALHRGAALTFAAVLGADYDTL
jgi:SAM-dependent methyltransferase